MAELFIPSLQDFISKARNTGFARRNRFLVEFFPPRLTLGGGIPSISNQNNTIGMMCEEATFPGKIIETRSLRINALTEQRASHVDYKNRMITFRFLVDNTWSVKDFFNQWMSLAVNPMTIGGSRPREVGFYKDYIGEINIYSLTPIFETDSTKNAETTLYGIKLREAWPTVLENQEMSSGAEGYHRLTVGITFKWWEDILLSSEVPSSQFAERGGGATQQDIISRLSAPEQRRRSPTDTFFDRTGRVSGSGITQSF